jgi:CDP-4-dehydro-6-deoxyglucose reductase, E1
MVGVDDAEWYDKTLVRRPLGRRSETYMFGSRKGSDDRFGPLADGTPYDLLFVFDDMGYNFEPSEIMAAYGLVQMDKLDGFNRRRQQAARAIDEAMKKHGETVIRPRFVKASSRRGCATRSCWLRASTAPGPSSTFLAKTCRRG